MVNQFEDEVSLRSLPMPAQHGSCMPSGPQGGNGNGVGGPSGTGSAAHSLGGQQADQRSLHSTHVHMSNLNPPRSMSPVSNFSGDELSHGGRRSQRRRPLLDKQVSKFSRFFFDREQKVIWSIKIPFVHMNNLYPPRSMQPVSNFSGDELSHGGRRSQRRRPLLDKQVGK